MKEKRWLVLKLIFAGLLIVISIWQFGLVKAVQEAHNESHLISQWTRITGLFDTNSSEPLLYYRNGEYAIFVEENQLFYKEFSNEAQVLHTWSKPTQGEIWMNGSALLVGTEAEEEGMLAEWFAIILPDSNKDKPSKVSFDREHFFGPKDVISVGISQEPSIFLITIKNNTTYNEVIYKLGEKDFIWVTRSLHPAIDWDEFIDEIPKTLRQPIELKSKSFPLKDRTIYTFEDERGVIVYQESDLHPQRYVDFRGIDFKVFQQKDSEYLPIGHLQYKDGASYNVQIGWGYHSFLPYDNELWQEDWEVLRDGTLVQIMPEGITFAKYQYDHEERLLKKEKQRSSVIEEGTYLRREGDYLVYLIKEKELYLSLYDLINNPKEETTISKGLWITPLAKVVNEEEGKKEYVYHGGSMEKLLPKPKDVFQHIYLPEGMSQGINELYHGCYGHHQVIGNFAGEWYLILDKNLYEFKDSEMILLGELPVTLNQIIGEGVSGIGPQDFLFLQGTWYVADTYGNRILQLDKNLQIIKEVSITLPYQINKKNHKLEVLSVEGKYTLDLDLNLLDQKTVDFFRVNEGDLESRTVFLDSYYEDSKNQLIWYYGGEGYLHQYNPIKNEARSIHLGYMINHYGSVKVLPYKEDILVVLDTRLFIFGGDGEIKRVLSFPRGNPDGLYTQTAMGENSYQLDEAGNKLYLVQGYRILEIDLDTSVVTVIFRQDFSDIGSMILHKNKLYFTLLSNQALKWIEAEDIEDVKSSIVILDLKKKESERFLLDIHYQLEDIIENELILWRLNKPSSGLTEGKRLKYPIGDLKNQNM